MHVEALPGIFADAGRIAIARRLRVVPLRLEDAKVASATQDSQAPALCRRELQTPDLGRLATTAIAAAVLGGCSLRGGEGSILGIVLGQVLLQVLQNLVNILGIPSSLNFAVMGTVILLGVLADQILQRRRKQALVRKTQESAVTPVHARVSANG